MHRVSQSLSHLSGGQNSRTVLANEAKNNIDAPGKVRWNGWGYDDTEFLINQSNVVELKGKRYMFSGKTLPALLPFFEAKAGLDAKVVTPSQKPPKLANPIRNEPFLAAMQNHCHSVSLSDSDRLFHSHGHTCQEVYQLRFGTFVDKDGNPTQRVVDAVVWPRNHEDVVYIMRQAHQHNVCVQPYGGGTSVSQALIPNQNETRMIVCVSMAKMNKIKWINKENMTACVEAGMIGKELENQLRQQGLTCGHEPDSMEFSTLGGWIATRASGMRKNTYGNIEDVVVNITCVLPNGEILQKKQLAERQSTGLNLNELIIGSEGTLGIVTEAIIRLRLKPAHTVYGSIVFPSFEDGVKFMRQVALHRCAPSSIRLVDNMQFQFGMCLKPPTEDWLQGITDKLKKYYLLQHKKFDPEQMVACTLLFEGADVAQIRAQERQVYSLAEKFGGIKGGAENGIRGYFLTYMIAYLRDFGFNHAFIAESFETSVPWENVLTLCNKVKQRIADEAKKQGIQKPPFVSCRVTQTYDTSACVYFYFGFQWTGIADPVRAFSAIEHAAREEILKIGGSLSHHHGVGKLRQDFMKDAVGESGLDVMTKIKKIVDPKNILGNANMGLSGSQ